MKPEMLLALVSLLSVGCQVVKVGQVDLHDPKARDEIISGAIEEGKLQKRGKKGEELYYAPGHDAPYTGWAKIVYENGQVEEQAIDRVHRIGQRYPVVVRHFLMQGSVEARILELQRKKMAMVNSALGGGTKEEAAKMRLDELKMLFT